MRRVRIGAAFIALLAVPASTAFGASPAYAATSINGSGSSWAGPALDQWRRDVGPQGVNINFAANGSAAGRNDWNLGLNDFTASDVPFRSRVDTGAGAGNILSQPERPVYGYSYVPVTAGGTTFMYNLVVGGKQVTNLRLTPDTLVNIFTNKIAFWDDPKITADYGATLPHIPITPVIRSDGSGATAQWTRYMEHTHQAQWDAYCKSVNGVSCGDYTEFFPGSGRMRAQNGSDVVANYIMSPTGLGAIGYDEYAYAKLNNWPVVKVLNPAGYWTIPTASNVAIALTAAKIRGVDDSTSPNDPNYLQQNLDGVYVNTDNRSYPISSYSYLIVPRDIAPLPQPPRFTADHGSALSRYISYILCTGQGEADRLGYSPIPRNLVRGGMLQNQHIPGQQMGVDPNTLANCPNPTFNSAGQLTVLVSAPHPGPCDYRTAPLSCTVVGGKAVKAGSGGTGTNAGGTNGTAGADPGATGTPDAGAAIDPLTGQPLADGAGANAQNPAASVVQVGSRGDNWLLASLTALEILGVVIVPPALGTYLKRRRRPAGGVKP
jgi:ABC-type phosphate transport system substrate-binding protein